MTDRDDWLATMHPAYFAMVMATGIVSIALWLVGPRALAVPMLWLNSVAYVVLWGLTALRVVRFRARVVADASHHGRAPGFLTVVAATCVLGSQWLIISNAWHVAVALWVLGIALWAVLTYGIFTVLTVKAEKPSLAEGINGGWLVAVVAAQAVSVLGVQLASRFGDAAPMVLFFCLALWLGGGMLYIWIISIIFYRYTFVSMQPSDLTPPYWINMGAVAISTLAGSLLVGTAGYSPLIGSVLPFVKGLTLMFWATATWWIPMLAILGIWRHVYRQFPLRYDPLYWGAVFPLGMYTVATLRLAQALELPWLMAVPRAFVFIAGAAWMAAAIGLVRAMWRGRQVVG